MSKQDIETLRAVYEAINRGDWDAAFRDTRPDFAFKVADQNPIAGTYRGREEVRGFFDEMWAAFQSVSIQPEQFLELEDRILVLLAFQVRPNESDSTIQMRIAHLWTMQNGKAARCEVFAEQQEALEAVGLSE